MSGTFLCPNSCGFAKVVALEIARGTALTREQDESTTKYQARLKLEQFHKFKNAFSSESFSIDFLKFHKKLAALREKVNKWNTRKLDEKRKFLDTFSLKNWDSLSDTRKKEHSLANCKSCAVRHASVQAYFPVKSLLLKSKAMSNPVFAARTAAQEYYKTPDPKPLQKDIKTTAKDIYNEIDSVFEKRFKTNFADALSKVPELNIQHKSKNDRRRERRHNYKQNKDSIEKQMKETSFLRCYGSGQSLSAWGRSRKALSFETQETAKRRKEENSASSKKIKNHTGNLDTINWNGEALKTEVLNYSDGHQINWSKLAQKHNVRNKANELAKNGGQIVKEWLSKESVDVHRFASKRKSDDKENPTIRRKRRKTQGGEISIPVDVDQHELRRMLKEKIQSKEYTIGDRIVPRQYEKLVLTKDLEIKKIQFHTEGRKVALKEIREKLLVKQRQYLRATSDQCIEDMSEEQLVAKLKNLNELNGIDTNDSHQMKQKLKEVERTRHLMIWLDNSTVANSGYLACLVTCLYDPAVYYTNEEFKEEFGKSVNIQKIIEEPEVHFIAKCGSSDNEQLLYCQERLKCIVDLKNNCTEQSSHIKYTDKMRFCHGDSPLRAFEAGHQKGGNYFCSSCGIQCDMSYCLANALNCEFTSLEKRQKAILQGTVARRNSYLNKPKPLNGLSIQELEQELASRNIYEGKNKADLQELLVKALQGKQRVPALLINKPEASLFDLGLDSYEILPCEPLHDIGHHIENVFAELPHHLTPEESKVIEESISLSLAGKESKRCVDYRMALIKTAAVAHQSGKVSKEVLDVFDTLVEMQRILYADDDSRSPTQILRYYNQAWYHSILLHDFIVNHPKKLTRRKMFGMYFHNLSAHAGDMLRIISGQSANAERQERIFNSIKRITKQTSNYHPGHVIPNLFVRLQAEKQLGLQGNDAARQQAQVSNLAKSLPPSHNTVIPISIIKKHSEEWQAHLQHISDFLLEGEGVWWHKAGDAVEFYDVSNSPDPSLKGPQLHHFRSSTLSEEENYMKSCWDMCIQENKVIPLHIIKIDHEKGTSKIYTPYLGDTVPNLETEALEQQEEEIEAEDEETYQQTTDSSLADSDTCPHPEEDDNDQVLEVYPASDDIIDLQSDINHMNNSQPPTQKLNAISNQMNNITEQTKQTTVFNTKNQGLKSSLCTAIEVVLGPSKELLSLDKTHLYLKELKQKKRTDPGQEKKYREDLAHLQVKVLAERTKAEAMLVDWERNYTINNGLVAPSQDQMKSDKKAVSLLKVLKYANALLKEWKIDFS